MRFLLGALLLATACGGSSGYADKCRLACDPTTVTACATMDPAACQRDCEAYVSGLTATCATCVTQTNSWGWALDNRQSGQTGCHGYGFPSITDTSSMGCGTVCK